MVNIVDIEQNTGFSKRRWNTVGKTWIGKAFLLLSLHFLGCRMKGMPEYDVNWFLWRVDSRARDYQVDLIKRRIRNYVVATVAQLFFVCFFRLFCFFTVPLYCVRWTLNCDGGKTAVLIKKKLENQRIKETSETTGNVDIFMQLTWTK